MPNQRIIVDIDLPGAAPPLASDLRRLEDDIKQDLWNRGIQTGTVEAFVPRGPRPGGATSPGPLLPRTDDPRELVAIVGED